MLAGLSSILHILTVYRCSWKPSKVFTNKLFYWTLYIEFSESQSLPELCPSNIRMDHLKRFCPNRASLLIRQGEVAPFGVKLAGVRWEGGFDGVYEWVGVFYTGPPLLACCQCDMLEINKCIFCVMLKIQQNGLNVASSWLFSLQKQFLSNFWLLRY